MLHCHFSVSSFPSVVSITIPAAFRSLPHRWTPFAATNLAFLSSFSDPLFGFLHSDSCWLSKWNLLMSRLISKP
ncbi:hypothetical protein QYF36_003975 [Acer negundo]|nr:hypothetical protein QYF36_003975 [Acer negundo]